METIISTDISKIKREKAKLEQKLNVKIGIQGEKVTIDGDPIAEYEALSIVEAIAFGFPVEKALNLTSEEITFRKIHIREFTRRKNLLDVKSRLIGTHGKTKHTIEEISGCSIIIKDNNVGIIGTAENIEEATQGITNLIRGSKQSNVYRFLERLNSQKRKR